MKNNIKELDKYEFGASFGQAMNLLINNDKLTLQELISKDKEVKKQTLAKVVSVMNSMKELKDIIEGWRKR